MVTLNYEEGKKGAALSFGMNHDNYSNYLGTFETIAESIKNMSAHSDGTEEIVYTVEMDGHKYRSVVNATGNRKSQMMMLVDSIYTAFESFGRMLGFNKLEYSNKFHNTLDEIK